MEDCVRSRVIQNNFFQTSNSDLLDFIVNWRSKKRWLRLIGTHKSERITFKHPEISELWLHIFYWRYVFKTTTTATLKVKQKEPKAKGLGNKPRTSDNLMTRKLKNCMLPNALEYPQAIINTLWLNSTLHFNLCGGKLTDTSNPSKRLTEKSIRCIGRIFCNKKKITWSLGDTVTEGFSTLKRI